LWRHFLYLPQYFLEFFLEWEIFETNVEKIKTLILDLIFFSGNLAFYEIMWKNVVEPVTPQVTIRRMRIAG
jgi:hypothetical protein